MKCKDIPDWPILEFLAELYAWDFQHPSESRYGTTFGAQFDNSVLRAMPEGTPEKLARAKMAMMVRRGVVEGCTCGCRGDFEITPKGREELRRYRMLRQHEDYVDVTMKDVLRRGRDPKRIRELCEEIRALAIEQGKRGFRLIVPAEGLANRGRTEYARDWHPAAFEMASVVVGFDAREPAATKVVILKQRGKGGPHAAGAH